MDDLKYQVALLDRQVKLLESRLKILEKPPQQIWLPITKAVKFLDGKTSAGQILANVKHAIVDTPQPEGVRILRSTTRLAHAGLHQRK